MLPRLLRLLPGRRRQPSGQQRPQAPLPAWAGPAVSFTRQVNWRAARRASRACCCPARPVIIAVVPPSTGRVHAVDVLLCAHHYRRSRTALAATGAALLHISGLPVRAGALPEIWAT
jgi:hypothetical protein